MGFIHIYIYRGPPILGNFDNLSSIVLNIDNLSGL